MSIRTSLTDPIRIAQVSHLDHLGKIGLTICPGKKGPSSIGANWDRDLDRDLAVIKEEFDPRVVITLMTDEELKLSKVPVTALSQKIKDLNVEWIHLPINDLKAPDKAFEAAWGNNLSKIISELSFGGNVLVHCRGGLGRSGVVASMILMELGVNAKEAMLQVRRKRPGAIETPEQESYVDRYLASGPPLNILPWGFLKCMNVVGYQVANLRQYLVDQAKRQPVDSHSFPLALRKYPENEDVFQFAERQGVSRGEVLKTVDEYVKDFDHYLGDVAIQFDLITRNLDINGRYFPTQLCQWLPGAVLGREANQLDHWVFTMDEALKQRVLDWYKLDDDKREKVNWAIEKLSHYFQDYKVRTEERQSRHSRWLVSTDMDIVPYLDTLAKGFREPRLGPFEHGHNPFLSD